MALIGVVVAAAYVLELRVCTFYQCTLDVDATRDSPSEGRTFRVDDRIASLCRVAKDVDSVAFYDLVRRGRVAGHPSNSLWVSGRSVKRVGLSPSNGIHWPLNVLI